MTKKECKEKVHIATTNYDDLFYKSFLDKADRLYLTLIDAELEGDTYFPDYMQYKWQEVERIEHQADEKNPYPYSFVILDRIH